MLSPSLGLPLAAARRALPPVAARGDGPEPGATVTRDVPVGAAAVRPHAGGDGALP